MTDVTKRNMLKKMGVSSALIAANVTIINGAEASSGSSLDDDHQPNFGIFNNSDESQKVNVKILGQGSELLAKEFELRGLNEPQVEDREETFVKGVIDIQARNKVGFPSSRP